MVTSRFVHTPSWLIARQSSDHASHPCVPTTYTLNTLHLDQWQRWVKEKQHRSKLQVIPIPVTTTSDSSTQYHKVRLADINFQLSIEHYDVINTTRSEPVIGLPSAWIGLNRYRHVGYISSLAGVVNDPNRNIPDQAFCYLHRAAAAVHPFFWNGFDGISIWLRLRWFASLPHSCSNFSYASNASSASNASDRQSRVSKKPRSNVSMRQQKNMVLPMWSRVHWQGPRSRLWVYNVDTNGHKRLDRFLALKHISSIYDLATLEWFAKPISFVYFIQTWLSSSVATPFWNFVWSENELG